MSNAPTRHGRQLVIPVIVEIGGEVMVAELFAIPKAFVPDAEPLTAAETGKTNC